MVEHEHMSKPMCVSSITTFIFPVNAFLYDYGFHTFLFVSFNIIILGEGMITRCHIRDLPINKNRPRMLGGSVSEW